MNDPKAEITQQLVTLLARRAETDEAISKGRAMLEALSLAERFSESQAMRDNPPNTSRCEGPTEIHEVPLTS
jgi:F0F1-type ATP synthase epsilon subunit